MFICAVFKSHTFIEAMINMSAHQLLQHNQPCLELLWAYDINAANQHMPEYYKTFDSLKYFWEFQNNLRPTL